MKKHIITLCFLIVCISGKVRGQSPIQQNSSPADPQFRGIYHLPETITVLQGIVEPDKNAFYTGYNFDKAIQTANRSNDIIATGTGKDFLLPGEYSYFKVNTNTQNVTYYPLNYNLHSSCQDAINRAPDWLEKDLILQFRKLKRFNLDDDYAKLILDADANMVDEVAFQVAHIAVETLASTRFKANKELIIKNAQHIYNVVDSLKYVRLKEYGDFSTGDYYTTSEYRVKKGTNGDTVWTEIPRDIYYWYVVHPKIDREALAIQDNSSDRTYGYFYKDYIWYNPDSVYDYRHVDTTMVYVDAYKTYMPGIYKGDSAHKHRFLTLDRFGELMQKPEILWNRNQTYYPFLRPYKNSDHALDVLGNWASRAIPVITDGKNRPFQPNQGLYEHNGNCHEDAILIVAACRTALIPVVHRNSSGEDHAWAAIFDEDWYHYEFFRGGLDISINEQFRGMTNLLKGGSYGWTTSVVHASRSDGFLHNHTSYYTDKKATLHIKVSDKNGVPVDNANIILWCNPGPYGPGWKNQIGYFWTGFDGVLDIEVGAGKQYAYQIYHPNYGYLPNQTQGTLITTSNAVDGQTYNVTAQYTEKEMPLISMNSTNTPDTADYAVFLDIHADEIVSGINSTGYNKDKFTLWQEDKGSLAFFICDYDNFQKFKNKQSFDAWEGLQRGWKNIKASLPAAGEYYVVLSNGVNSQNIQYFEADCDLISDAGFVGKNKQAPLMDMHISPNPFTDQCTISFNTLADKVIIHDIFGRIIYSRENTDLIQWAPEASLPKGIYILKAIRGQDQISKKLLYN
jgi:hypothetical protein